jgi:hypothetical protein
MPIVIYNGDRAWNAATNLEQMLGIEDDSPLRPWMPALQFKLVDIGRLAPELLEQSMTLASLFKLELLADTEAIKQVLLQLNSMLQTDGLEPHWRPILAWLAQVLKVRNFTLDPEHLPSFPVGTSMLAANIEKMLQLELQKGIEQGIERGREEGREEGREQGREDGVLEGKRASLLKQLAFKFGPASDERTQRVSLMLHEQLDRAIELVLIAQHEHEVFATTDHTP